MLRTVLGIGTLEGPACAVGAAPQDEWHFGMLWECSMNTVSNLFSECPYCGALYSDEERHTWVGADARAIHHKCQSCGRVWVEQFQIQGTTLAESPEEHRELVENWEMLPTPEDWQP